MSNRIQKVNQVIKQEIAKLIFKEVEFPPGVLVTVTRVETSADLKESKIFIGAIQGQNPRSDIRREMLDIINKKIYLLQQKLNKKLVMKPVPKLNFLIEEKTVQAGRIEEILEQLKKEKK